MSKVIVYHMLLKATRDKDQLKWNLSKEDLDRLLLGIDWSAPLSKYNLRSRFYWGFSISGSGEEAFPVLEGKVEATKASLETPEFTLELAAMPSKLDITQREMLHQTIEKFIENEDFKLWWETDARGPRRRPLHVKKELLEEIKQIKPYNGSDDLKLEDVAVSIKDALSYFGYENNPKAKEVTKTFKKKLKDLQVKCHPDSDTGSEDSFIYLQKCRKVMEGWLKK